MQTEFWPCVQPPIDLTAYLSDSWPGSVPASRNVPQPAPQVAAPWTGAHDGPDVIPLPRWGGAQRLGQPPPCKGCGNWSCTC